jgi:hypothetical protein
MDRRLVQTAVIGGPEADEPVILPEDHGSLDAFRDRHAETSFFCGVLLGGCGRALTTKRYEDRTCHFAHLADADGPSSCSRGRFSADHLYLRRAVRSWLASHGHDVEGDLQGDGPQVAVEFHLPAGTWLRFQLSTPGREEIAGAELRAGENGGRITWFLPPSHAGQDPGAGTLLVRCQDAGSPAAPERRVEIGSYRPFAQPAWDRLEACVIDIDGLVQTPARRRRGEPPVSPRRMSPSEAPTDPTPWTPPLPKSKPRRPERNERDVAIERALARAAELAGELRRWPVSPEYLAYLIAQGQDQASQLAELGTQHDPLNAAIESAADYFARRTAPPPELATQTEPELRGSAADITVLGRIAERALIQAARERRPLSWRALCAKMRRDDLAEAGRTVRSAILAAADRDQPGDARPLLSALVADPGGVNFDPFWHIARQHGRTVPSDPQERGRFRQHEIELIYLRWPPRMPPSPRRPGSNPAQRRTPRSTS